VRGNYATLNPLSTPGYTYTNGNLDVSGTTPSTYAPATIALPLTGKYYFEYTCTNTAGSNRRDAAGVVDLTKPKSYLSNIANTVVYHSFDGNVYDNNGVLANQGTWTNGDVCQCAIDCDTGKVWFGKNGSFSGSPAAGTGQVTTLTNNGNLAFAVGSQDNTGSPFSLSGSLNFGQRAFAYTAPSGFKALCTQNLPAPLVTKSNTVMDVALYTGNGGTQTISGLGFSPDLVWIKSRSNSGYQHVLQDVVRGAGKSLFSSLTSAEIGNAGDLVGAFNSDGFSLNNNYNGGTAPETNGSGSTYVGWAWDAGTSTVSNTQGSITSQVRANATAGFSVVTYTAPSSGAFTVGHGLGVSPSFYITKSRSNAYSWGTYHASIGNTGRLDLNTTNAVTTSQNAAWNNTSPTSTVFSVGSDWAGSGITYVAYCFAPVVGYSNFGSYTGNGSTDGPFVYTGMRPRWILIKWTTGSNAWIIIDTARDPYNVSNKNLNPNDSSAENTASSGAWLDHLSNGFKIRNGTDSVINSNGATYIYAAFAEMPFNYSRAR
jgi:hypothetical protein